VSAADVDRLHRPIRLLRNTVAHRL
jgi:hypothetical protein